MNSFSERLAFLMKKHGLSQAELARRIQVKRQTIQHILASDVRNSKLVFDIAMVFNVNDVWLATGVGSIYPSSKELSVLKSLEEIRAFKKTGEALDAQKIYSELRLTDNAFAFQLDPQTLVITDSEVYATEEYLVLSEEGPMLAEKPSHGMPVFPVIEKRIQSASFTLLHKEDLENE